MNRNSFSLIVCSNRKNVSTQSIWGKIINNADLAKIIFSSQAEARGSILDAKKVLHLKLDSIGRSRALNEGFANVDSKYIILTDDDCVIDRDFLKYALWGIRSSKLDLMYGQTRPYHPKEHKNEYCPSTFSKKPNVFSFSKGFGKHWEEVGYDNNVVIKKSVINNIGVYKWWLGPKSIIPSAEDAEFILRAQIAGYKIAYNPKMLVYHNKWMTKIEYDQLIRDYTLGGICAYAFYAFQGVTWCKSIMLDHINFYINEIKLNLKKAIKRKSPFFKSFEEIMYLTSDLVRGLFVAFVFAKIVPIPPKENVVKRYSEYRK